MADACESNPCESSGGVMTTLTPTAADVNLDSPETTVRKKWTNVPAVLVKTVETAQIVSTGSHAAVFQGSLESHVRQM